MKEMLPNVTVQLPDKESSFHPALMEDSLMRHLCLRFDARMLAATILYKNSHEKIEALDSNAKLEVTGEMRVQWFNQELNNHYEEWVIKVISWVRKKIDNLVVQYPGNHKIIQWVNDIQGVVGDVLGNVFQFAPSEYMTQVLARYNWEVPLTPVVPLRFQSTLDGIIITSNPLEASSIDLSNYRSPKKLH
jgi:hypothetical protein